MHPLKRISLSLVLATAFATACGDDGSDTDNPSTGGPITATNATATDTPTTADPTADPTNGATTNDPSTTNDPTDPTGDPNDPFVFDETPPEQLVQLDRMGMPAVATAVISKELKDNYNASTPSDDAASTFVPDIVMNLVGLHAALDDDLMTGKLVPCAKDTCVAQAAPLVVPDTLQIDISKQAGFPNGRRLTDPCVDITLAVVMLDLSAPGQTAATLADVPVNPPKNDKEFAPEFPYLASPH
ncbi:MAG: DUF4331 family protein [Nannocystis sp.]|uniref:DUF4331 family protein n=1 Tax=Nannocystis sp. TaxID=1962667 RepID=UPI002425075F|nr:DUF4331 family protein [Nannocystis sp.]MBK9753762.1 DUF4331 family protein [Nannocystis sp.]